MKKTPKGSITYSEAWEIATLLRPSIKIQNEIGFGDMPIKAPDIDVYEDDVSYFDPNVPLIHLGVYGIVDMFLPPTEESFVGGLNYVRAHEEQHCRSTASEPYSWAIKRGTQIVIEYIAEQVEKSKKRFRKDEDYVEYVNNGLRSKGIYIKYHQLQEIAANIANSVEDGRIEAIRASRLPGFALQRRLYRGIFWNTSEMNLYPVEEIHKEPAKKLELYINTILTLATCQIYPKGFIAAYGEDDEIMGDMLRLMPLITKGIMATRTREMSVKVTEIIAILAPLMYEVCTMSDLEKAMTDLFEKLFGSLIKSLIDNFDNGNLSEKQEDVADSSSPDSVFSHSDLVITLDDETYDKLKENSKPGSGSGLMIRREHPLPEPESDEKKDGKGGGGDGKPDEKENEGEGKGGGKSGKDKNDEPEKNSGGEETSDPQKDSSGGFEDENREGKPGSGFGESKNTDPNKEMSDELEKTIRDEMEKAANEIYAAAKEDVSKINEAAAHTAKAAATTMPVVPDQSKPISPESVKNICPRFKELKRAYKLQTALPPVIMARGQTLLRKNRQYFKSMSTPNISYLDQGSVDPSRIYGLAYGDTEIFRKKGVDRRFDGCVYMLIDNSGSMYGNKRVEACKAAAVIEESFRGLIPIKIVAFDENNCVIHEVIKGWNEQQRLNCCWNFCLHGRNGNGNADGYDILIATKELLERPERKKLLLVLSDGMPTETTAGFTKGAIEQARKQGVKVTGIYFEEGAVGDQAKQFKDMYGNGDDAIAVPLDELDKQVWKVMKKFSRS